MPTEPTIEIEVSASQLDLLAGIIGTLSGGTFSGFHITRREDLASIAEILHKASIKEFARVIASPKGGLIAGAIAEADAKAGKK